jgi:hypothetical protein
MPAPGHVHNYVDSAPPVSGLDLYTLITCRKYMVCFVQLLQCKSYGIDQPCTSHPMTSLTTELACVIAEGLDEGRTEVVYIRNSSVCVKRCMCEEQYVCVCVSVCMYVCMYVH